MGFKDLCVLVLWMKVALAFEGLDKDFRWASDEPVEFIYFSKHNAIFVDIDLIPLLLICSPSENYILVVWDDSKGL